MTKQMMLFWYDLFRSISLAEVRRTLEEDLKLKKKALDAYKSFITNELDKVC